MDETSVINTEPTIEAGEPKPIEAQAMVLSDPRTVDVREASADGVKLMRERVESQKQMLRIAISLTSPSQWTVFGESVYPTGGASDTILRRAFGLSWGPKDVEVTYTEDGDPQAVCGAWLMQNGVQLEYFQGFRSMGGFIKNEADLRKGAIENMKSVAVRDLLGLRFRTADEMRELGLDVGKLKRKVEFQDRKGSDVGKFDVVQFGKNKGKPLSELTDKSLEWYIESARKNLEDDDQKKYWEVEEKRLAGYIAEQKRRGDSE